MSTLRDPVGPKDRKVYIRRRLIVLAVLLAVIAVIVLIIVKPGSNAGARDAQQIEVPDDLGTAAPPDADSGTEPAADGEEPPACGAGQVRVDPITDKTDYASGELPQLALAVENTGSSACTADLGTAGMEFVVSSGEDEVWRSMDCQANPASMPVILDPGKSLQSEAMQWDRTRSDPETCDVTRDPVSADGASYHLRVSVAGVPGNGTAQFLLF